MADWIRGPTSRRHGDRVDSVRPRPVENGRIRPRRRNRFARRRNFARPTRRVSGARRQRRRSRRHTFSVRVLFRGVLVRSGRHSSGLASDQFRFDSALKKKFLQLLLKILFPIFPYFRFPSDKTFLPNISAPMTAFLRELEQPMELVENIFFDAFPANQRQSIIMG